jgi:hypothetical protein
MEMTRRFAKIGQHFIALGAIDRDELGDELFE